MADRTLRVYKYDIPILDEFTLKLPASAEPLHVEVQREQPRMWVLLSPTEHPVTRRFRFAGTGHNIILAKNETAQHIGTLFMEGGALVFHIFEVTTT